MRNKWTDTFLHEAEDLLAQIETSTLTLQDANTSDEIVGDIFRSFHTIKGSGAMAGLDCVASFAHHVESLLDDVREGRVPISPKIIDVVLASVDHIRVLLEAEQSDSAQAISSGHLIATVHALSASSAVASVGRTEFSPAASSPSEQLTVQTCEGLHEAIWEIFFRPNPDLFATGGNPHLLFRDLRKLGKLEVNADTSAVPVLKDLHPLICYIAWTLILQTAADENAIRDVFMFVEDGAELRLTSKETRIVPGVSIPREHVTRGGAVSESEPHLNANVSDANVGSAHLSSPVVNKASHKASVVRVPSERLDRLVNIVGELVMNQSRLARAVSLVGNAELLNPVQEIDRLIAELRDDVLSIRMLPIGSIFGRFRRLVHDLSAELGKEVDLITEGEDTELDKSILDQLGEPLVHLLRNSIDHGIEAAEQRQSRGKERRGRIRLSAAHMGSRVVVTVEDDGRGINRQAIRAKAIERKLISEDASLTDRELLNLILAPGFSTAQKLTSVSGRGVGMDVVKQEIEALRGSVVIASEEGVFTKIMLSLPLTLAIIEGQIVQLGDDQFIIPMAAIAENIELEHAERIRRNRRNAVIVRGEFIPYVDLRAAFCVPGDPPLIEKVVIVRHEEDLVGLVVDRVVGTHQTVLQPLGRFFSDIDIVSGATILGDGRVALVLDIAAIVRFAENQNHRAIARAS